jgi:gamma-glutamyltranspeptidase/glutathione hydrolase
MTAADLSEYSAEWVQPISTDYRGWRVYEMPPNSQGIAALEMLNLFAQFPLNNYFSRTADELHIQIEAQKLAYADLQRYVADPRFAKVPVDGMLSLGYARQRAKLINPRKANCEVAPGQPLPGAGETIYLSVVDRDGNIVSLIQIAAACLRWTPGIRMRSRPANGPSIPSFPASWRRATCTSGSASWAG